MSQVLDEDLRYEILSAVSEIPEGRVASYGQIARLIGRPKNARLVGRVLRQASAYGDFPCHRVVRCGTQPHLHHRPLSSGGGPERPHRPRLAGTAWSAGDGGRRLQGERQGGYEGMAVGVLSGPSRLNCRTDVSGARWKQRGAPNGAPRCLYITLLIKRSG